MTYTWTQGQRVLWRSNRGGGGEDIQTIERVTPSGRAVIGRSQYRQDGSFFGPHDPWGRQSIRPLTPDDDARLTLRDLCSRVRDAVAEASDDTFTADVCRAILAALGRTM